MFPKLNARPSKARLVPSVLAVISSFSAALLVSASAFAVGDIARGRTLYAAQCQTCHGGPTTSVPRRSANNTPVLTAAINNVTSMQFLATVLSIQDRDDITTYIGNPNGTVTNTPPSLSYSPANALTLSGMSTDLGASASGTIEITPGGGSGSGLAATTALDQCTVSGATNIAVAAANFNFVGPTTGSRMLSASCVRTAVVQSAALSCKESKAGVASTRSWQLSCPAAAPAPVPPDLGYYPSNGAKVFFTSNVRLPNTQLGSMIYIDPVNGAGTGVAASKTLGECAISGMDAATFAIASTDTLQFQPDSQNGYIDLRCTRAAATTSATLSCVERTAGANPVTRSWPLSCPAIGQISPQTGWYWNAAEGGRGFFVENRNGSLFMASFLYLPTGPAWWFAGSGAITGPDFSSAMLTLENGQTLLGAYRAPTVTTSPGTVQLKFATDSTALVTWPGGTVPLTRFPFTDLTAVKPPQAGAPEGGWWWSETESGRGFAIDFEADVIFLAGFMYDTNGQPVWYASTGDMATPKRYEGQLTQFANGQAMGAPYKPAQQINAAVGLIKIDFTDTRNARLTLPDGRIVQLVRQPQ
jgi:hypothetical protein